MGRRKALTLHERGFIDGLTKDNRSASSIACEIGRSAGVVLNYLKDKQNYNTKRSPGRPRLYTPIQERGLLIEIKKNKMSSAQAKNGIGLPGCRQTAWRVVKRCPYLKKRKRLKKPTVKIAKDYMSWTTEWSNVIFSDEKKFNLDGPDSFNYYWHDIRDERDIKFSKQQGDGGVSVWAAIGYN